MVIKGLCSYYSAIPWMVDEFYAYIIAERKFGRKSIEPGIKVN